MTRKRYSIAATCFDKKGNVLGTGTNQYSKSHSLMKYFAVKAGESDQKIWIHAELAAVLSSGKKNIHKILVQRYNQAGEPAMAKPCPTCQEMLKAYGVSVVQYTTTDGIVEEFIKE